MSYFSKKSVVVAQESSYGTNRVGVDVVVGGGGGDSGGSSYQYIPKKKRLCRRCGQTIQPSF